MQFRVSSEGAWVAFVLAVLLSLACSPSATADVITIGASRDNTLYEDAQGRLSNGAGQHMFSGMTNQPLRRRALLAFDVAGAIPDGSTINSVQLTLYLSRTRTQDETVRLHAVLREWGEGTSDASGEEGAGAIAQPGDATWIHTFHDTQQWSQPGGDYAAAASASAVVGRQSGYFAWSSASMAADVQMWLDAPETSQGWVLIGNESASRTAKRFDTREYPDPSRRPALRIDFTPPAPTGACCLDDGSCVAVLGESECDLLGGTYQGDGTSCEPNPCPRHGACCLPDGSCENLSEIDCLNAGGSYQGDGTDCASTECPLMLEPFVDALPIPAVAQPISGQVGGEATYRLAATQQVQKLHRDLPATTVWGYSGSYPGPTIEASAGLPVTVQWVNDLRDEVGNLRTSHYLEVDDCLHGPDHRGDAAAIVTHLHGGHVPHEADGYPEDAYPPGHELTYVYPNNQLAAPLWYHDHALGITRLNVYMGMAGFYLLRDDAERALDLPTGPYEIAMAIQDRSFRPDGSLRYPAEWQDHFYGDFPVVNGKVSPYLEVQRGRYRFRWLNGSTSRSYRLSLSEGMPIHVIGTDGGLLPRTVTVPEVLLAPGERADVIVDFSNVSPNTRIVLRNLEPAPKEISEFMQFRVLSARGDQNPVPTVLRPLDVIPEDEALLERVLLLERRPDSAPPCADPWWLINGLPWAVVSEYPRLGTTEIWGFVNRSGTVHPMHMHLVMFQVLDRQAFEMIGGEIVPIGDRMPPPDEEAGWKDTVAARPGEITRVIARFENYPGLFPYHCHILEHEDHEMMRQFHATCPGDFTGSADPGDPRYGVPDDMVNVLDFFWYLDQFAAGNAAADLSGNRIGYPDGVIDVRDFFYFLELFVEGCPEG